MMTLSQLITEARAKFESVEIIYTHPSLYLKCQHPSFDGLDDAQRESAFFQTLGRTPDDALGALTAGNVMLLLLGSSGQNETPSFLASAPKAHHWIEFLAQQSVSSIPSGDGLNIFHFYGYKGGQARSTILAMLSKMLADDGYRVLAVDADMEAPSLHIQYGAKISRLDSTLLGCVQYGLAPAPQPTYLARETKGAVDLVTCRPSGRDFDLDQAAFVLSAALNPAALQDGFGRLFSVGDQYDVILVDHRSGLGSSVLPIAAAFPGPVIACARLDEQSDEALSYFDVLFSLNPSLPGLFVSFSLDPDDSADKLMRRRGGTIDALLDILAKATSRGAVSDGSGAPEMSVSGDDLAGSWVSWFHDRSFLGKVSPPVDGISSDNRSALLKIRELLGVQAPKRPAPATNVPLSSKHDSTKILLTNSGNTDQGLLIQTDALRRLSVSNSPFTYVLGRKGTGKTRIVRALIERTLAVPLLVADDFPDQDFIKSADTLLKDIASRLPLAEAEKFWWVLLDAAVLNPKGGRREAIAEWLEKIKNCGSSIVSTSEIQRRIVSASHSGAYLIDGVETAFNSAQMGTYVEGLFRFLGSVQSDPELSQKLIIRLFIRTDLARRSVENVEQQIEGRSLELSWDTQSILNFALSRIASMEWFGEHFSGTMSKLNDSHSRLEIGAVSEAECNEFLLEIFPAKLRRNNLLTLTFLKDYFSEGVGESASFYPRIYDTFVRSIANPRIIGTKASSLQQIDGCRVAQGLIIAAHDYASREYLNQVVAELKNLIQLADEPKKNESLVEALISAFSGMPTPFELNKCLDQVMNSMRERELVPRDRILDALRRMKQVGIFEERPGYHGWWRVGRLFKTALGMKYVR